MDRHLRERVAQCRQIPRFRRTNLRECVRVRGVPKGFRKALHVGARICRVDSLCSVESLLGAVIVIEPKACNLGPEHRRMHTCSSRRENSSFTVENFESTLPILVPDKQATKLMVSKWRARHERAHFGGDGPSRLLFAGHRVQLADCDERTGTRPLVLHRFGFLSKPRSTLCPRVTLLRADEMRRCVLFVGERRRCRRRFAFGLRRRFLLFDELRFIDGFVFRNDVCIRRQKCIDRTIGLAHRRLFFDGRCLRRTIFSGWRAHRAKQLFGHSSQQSRFVVVVEIVLVIVHGLCSFARESPLTGRPCRASCGARDSWAKARTRAGAERAHSRARSN